MISNIKQSIQNIEYELKNPQSYLVFVPGISLIIQKIKCAHLHELIKQSIDIISPTNTCVSNLYTKKFIHICQWHYFGALTQQTASILAIKHLALTTLTAPIIKVLAALTLVQFIYASYQALQKMTIAEYRDNGTLKNIKIQAAVGFFFTI